MSDWSSQLKKYINAYPPSNGEDLRIMQEDIYFQLSKVEGFEVLRVEQTGKSERQVVAACISTLKDPFFKIVVAHLWQNDLAYDNEWHVFEEHELGTVLRFVTWEDAFITGEIWFDRKKGETDS